MRIVIHFARFEPYHHARLRAAHGVLSPPGWEVVGRKTAGNDAAEGTHQTLPMNDSRLCSDLDSTV